MKHLKKFNESINLENIDSICKKFLIKNYTIAEDGTLDINGSVDLSIYKLKKLPLKFNKVTGDFTCNDNELTSLEGCPKWVGGNFHCYNNKLKSLEYSPEYVGKDFYCSNNELVKLEYSPEYVGKDFYCSTNKLESLDGITQNLTGKFKCTANKLTSLNGLSENIYSLNCSHNPIFKYFGQIPFNKLEIFLYMNINSNDPEEINQQKMNYILEISEI